MDHKHEKIMTDLQRILATQNFKSEKELEKFLKKMLGQEVPSFPEESLSTKEKAQDLVYEAHTLPINKAKINIKKALELDPQCIEAYEFLGNKEKSIEKAIEFFKKGIDIGTELFGGKYLKENKGLFWGLHETRPYMRCLQQYADCLYTIGNVKECVDILEYLIALNPNDNQGVRDQLLLYLIVLDEKQKFIKYAKMFKEDDMAFSLFNRSLFAFKTDGNSDNANKSLAKAIKANRFVAPMLVSNTLQKELPNYYGIGDENEAKYYVSFAKKIWFSTNGAIKWLKEMSSK